MEQQNNGDQLEGRSLLLSLSSFWLCHCHSELHIWRTRLDPLTVLAAVSKGGVGFMNCQLLFPDQEFKPTWSWKNIQHLRKDNWANAWWSCEMIKSSKTATKWTVRVFWQLLRYYRGSASWGVNCTFATHVIKTTKRPLWHDTLPSHLTKLNLKSFKCCKISPN